MSIASSSSSSASALRSTVRPTRLASESRTPPYRRLRVLHDPPRRRLPPVHPLQVLIGAPYSLARHYTPLPAYREPDDPPTYRQPPRPVPIQSRYPQFNITPESAQTYLSDLLQLPPSRAFPPALALQILTHKSYRFVHLAKHHPSPASSASPSSSLSQSPSPMAELDEWASNHNSRLTFLGRRAIASYLAMFIHSCISSTISVRSLDFLRGKGLDGKLEEMRVVQNIGRSVGDPWRVDEVMRWDRNTTGEESGAAKIKGATVEAILGGVFSQLGSPAAHRTFHLHILPHLKRQLRDPRLIERVETVRDQVEKEFRGGILPVE